MRINYWCCVILLAQLHPFGTVFCTFALFALTAAHPRLRGESPGIFHGTACTVY